MHSPIAQSEKKGESDEEEYESFFLQPASCPYDMKEKVSEANRRLEMDIGGMFERRSGFRVQFCEELLHFESELTDDDVQSIESYTEEVIKEELKHVIQDQQLCDIIEEDIIEESIIESIIELNHKQIQEEEEECEDEFRQFPEETPEDVEEIEELIEELNISEEMHLPQPPEDVPVIEESSSSEVIPKRRKSRIRQGRRVELLDEINCKQHCIEALDSRLELCMTRLRLNEKPSKCPTLKLHRQKCCAWGCRREEKLPSYAGAHSEYGLTTAQIERLQKRREIVKVRAEHERAVRKAFSRRKSAQNESIFQQWLKDIAQRKASEREKDKVRWRRARSNCISAQKRAEQPRPKTANCVTSVQFGFSEGEDLRINSFGK